MATPTTFVAVETTVCRYCGGVYELLHFEEPVVATTFRPDRPDDSVVTVDGQVVHRCEAGVELPTGPHPVDPLDR